MNAKKRGPQWIRALALPEQLESKFVLATFMVTNLLDGPIAAAGDLPGSLRQAIFDANQLPGADEVVFDAANEGTVAITNGRLLITDDLTLIGLGSARTTIDGGHSQAVFRVESPEAYYGNFTSVEVRDITISRSESRGIRSHGNLTVRDSVITGGLGGGIANFGVSSTSRYIPTLTIERTTISDNRTTSDGGGILAFNSRVEIRDSTISGNQADDGGGIFTSVGFYTFARISNSTISGNLTSNRGGGISHSIGVLRINHSTITENTAPDGTGSGLRALSDYISQTEVTSTIISGNINSDVELFGGNVPAIISRGFNLVGTGAAASLFDDTSDMTGVTDPGLLPLAENGGPTMTHALMPASPAVDSGDPSAETGVNVPEFDQRGEPFARISGEKIDRGALELQEFALPDGDFNEDGIYDCEDIDALVISISGGIFDSEFDLTGDGLLNQADIDTWLQLAGEANLGPGLSYLPGDANLDGRVDVSDFNIWNQNKFRVVPAAPGWCDGDFNADAVVDVGDFNLWDQNKFSSSGLADRIPNDLIDRVFEDDSPKSSRLSVWVDFIAVTHRAGC